MLQFIHKWSATKEKHREKKESFSLPSTLPKCASRGSTEHSTGLLYPPPPRSSGGLHMGPWARLYSWQFTKWMWLWAYYTCSSKLQHIFFPISVRTILCETLFWGPRLLILWAWLPFLNHCFEKISYFVWDSFPSPDLVAPGCEQLQWEMRKGSTLCFAWKATDIFEECWPLSG